MSLDCSRQAGWETYTLQPGDTWESLASRYRVREEALKQYNLGFADISLELSAEDETLCVPSAGYHIAFTSEARAVSTAGWLDWERIRLTDVGPYVTGYNGDEGYYDYTRPDGRNESLYPGNYISETRTQEERGYLQPYFIQTEEDLLRWMWVNEWQRTDEFNETEAATLFENQIIEAIALMMQSEAWAYVEESVAVNADELTDQIIQAMIDFEGNIEAARSRLQELATQYNLDVNDLITLFNELVELAGANVYRYQVDPQLYEYVTLFYNMQTSAEGETVISYEDFTALQLDLAVLDYYGQVFGTYDLEQVRRQLIDRAIRLEYYSYLMNLPVDVLPDFSTLFEIDSATRSAIEAKTITQLYEHISELITTLRNGNQDHLGYLLNYLGGNEDFAGFYADELTQWQDEVARYYEAVALDSLRKIAYDPQWNLDENLLNQFEAAIEAMPRTIVGVGVGFAQDGFRAHYRILRRAHEWRIELRGQLNLIEAEMLRRQAEAQQPEPLWWLAEIALSLLWEPFDWFFTIRDLLQGNAWALLGFLPLVPHAIGAIMDAGRYLVNVSDEIAALVRQVNAESALWEVNANSVTSENVVLRKVNDPAATILGAAWGNPEYEAELRAIQEHMRQYDVEIRFPDDSTRMTYTPAFRNSFTGEVTSAPQFVLYQGASISAWRHEYQHFLDDLARNFPGPSVLLQLDVRWSMELNAYMQEIKLARDLDNQDLFDALVDLMLDEKCRIFQFVEDTITRDEILADIESWKG